MTDDEPAETIECCGNCRFYKIPRSEGHCCRRSPAPYDCLKYYELELLRDIAWSVHSLAQLPTPSEYDDLLTEATEAFSAARWPTVEPGEWCGEWRKGNAGDMHS